MLLNIHNEIYKHLNYFITIKKIPNIIFHGPSGSGKKTIVYNFLKDIYNTDENILNYTLYIDCAKDGKGIKFIREDLIFFAKKHIDNGEGEKFKSIILLNADKLTIDAQSALRRCIEVHTHTTRFFIVVENKSKLLKPILSRFCDFYISLPKLKSKSINLYKNNINNNTLIKENKKRLSNLSVIIKNNEKETISVLVELLYNKGFSGIDLLKYFTSKENIDNKYNKLNLIEKIRTEIRDETMIMYYIIYIFLRSNDNLENILIM